MQASAAALACQPFLDTMRQAGLAAGTDKIHAHKYEQVYGRALAPYANADAFAMLEIGYGSGQGVSFWHTLFPHAFLYCLDAGHGDWEDEETCVLRVDQSRSHDLGRAMAMVRHPISLIVDDGSHHPSHQLLSFSTLFRDLLLPGGLYIIEDVETSYWRRGSLYGYDYSHGLGNRHSAIEAFKLLIDFVNRRFLDPDDRNWLIASLLDVGIDPEAAVLVQSVSFGRNAIQLVKRQAPPSPEDQNAYVYSHFTSRDPQSSS